MLSRFHLVLKRNGQTDGQTDRQTDLLYQSRVTRQYADARQKVKRPTVATFQFSG